MEENKHTHLDDFLQKRLQEIPLESPSKDFTANLMNALSSEETSKSISYVPLISKKVWLGIAAVFIGILCIPFQKQEGGILEKVDLSFMNKISLPEINFDLGITIPTTVFYALLLFSIMIFIQIFYIKGHFNKQISKL